MTCMRCSGSNLFVDAVRAGNGFMPYRWKCRDCDFQWNVDPRTNELTYRFRNHTIWKLVPSGCLGIFDVERDEVVRCPWCGEWMNLVTILPSHSPSHPVAVRLVRQCRDCRIAISDDGDETRMGWVGHDKIWRDVPDGCLVVKENVGHG